MITSVTFFQELSYLQSLQALLHFDQETLMPKAAVGERAKLLSYVSEKHHQLLCSKQAKQALKQTTDIHIRKHLQKDIKDATKIPASLVSELSKTIAHANESWLISREKNSMLPFKKDLQKILTLTRKKIRHLNAKKHPYDVLLEDYEPGMTVTKLQTLFAKLKPQLVDMYQKVKTQKKAPKSIMKKTYAIKDEKSITDQLIAWIIPDQKQFTYGVTTHPFMTQITPNDIRIACAFRENNPFFSITSTAHECGHALYELQFPKKYQNTPVYKAASFGLHESQSRIWENHICKSKAFWQSYYPKVKKTLSLPTKSFQEFYDQLNAVEGSLIRIEGDELTYCLHIIIRFEIELELITGTLSVNNLEKRWNQKYKECFNKTPKSLKEGVLQDVHWSSGLFGYFPTYALGSIYSAQLFEKMKKTVDVDTCMKTKNFAPVQKWLKKHVHSYAATKTATQIVGEVNITPYLAYLEEKYVQI
ncbi:MAG: carboxypeptidase M32 [Candidatus Woesearchaeota archaeon]